MASPGGPGGGSRLRRVQLRSSEPANWWWARGFFGAVLAIRHGWLTARLQLSGRRNPAHAPSLIPLALFAYLALPPALIDWAATTACAFMASFGAPILPDVEPRTATCFLLPARKFSISGKALPRSQPQSGWGPCAVSGGLPLPMGPCPRSEPVWP